MYTRNDQILGSGEREVYDGTLLNKAVSRLPMPLCGRMSSYRIMSVPTGQFAFVKASIKHLQRVYAASKLCSY